MFMKVIRQLKTCELEWFMRPLLGSFKAYAYERICVYQKQEFVVNKDMPSLVLHVIRGLYFEGRT
jgi:hypothetical protein